MYPLLNNQIRQCGLVDKLGGTYSADHRSAIDKKTKKLVKRGHWGWDIDAPEGTRTYAIADGTICRVHAVDGGDFGKFITLLFEYKKQKLYAFYAHLSEISIRLGQAVSEGDVLGATGITGNAKGGPPHLHFEIREKPDLPKGPNGRMDPGEIFGYELYACRSNMITSSPPTDKRESTSFSRP